MKQLLTKLNFTSVFTFATVLIALLFVVPLYILEPLMWIWLLWIFINKKLISFTFNSSKLPFVFLVVLYLLMVVSLAYSADLRSGVKGLNTYLPVLLIPVLAMLTPVEKYPVNKVIDYLLLALFLGIIIFIVNYSIAIYTDNSYYSLLNINPVLAFRTILDHWMHRSYMALAIVMSLFFFYLKTTKRHERLLWFSSYIVSVLFVWYSGARLPLLYFFILLFGVIIDILKSRIKISYLLAVSFILVLVAIVLFLNHSGFNVFKNISNISSDQFVKLESRFQIWLSVKSILADNILFGVGIGDVKNILQNQYLLDGYDVGSILEYNSHNQFLHIWMEAGFMAMILFSFSIISILWVFKNVSFLYRVVFVSIFLSAFFVENLLLRVAGKEIFLFSMVLFYMYNGTNEVQLSLKNRSKWVLLAFTAFFVLIAVLFPYKKFFRVEPTNPVTYAQGVYEIVDYDNLPKTLKESVPYNTKGLLIDARSFEFVNKNEPYVINMFGNLQTQNNDSVLATVFCYVSEDFNGSDVLLFSRNELYQYNADTCNIFDSAQKLTIHHSCIKGELILGLFAGLRQDQMATNLKGYVIFAYPQYSIIKKN